MKVSVVTLGCKTNLSESDLFKAAALGAGHRLVDLNDAPDICIINTCTVTSKADYQCRQILRRALRAGVKTIMVTGCYAQMSPEEITRIYPDVQIVPIDKKDLIIKALSGDTSSSDIRIPRSRPFVKIQEGCDFRCSYCIVWKARGKATSRAPGDIVTEISKLEEAGYQEVVLTGTHIGLYGKDLDDKITLDDLLVTILNKTKNISIRLSSLEVQEISDTMVEIMASEERLCRHLHVPLQSGDDKILSIMKRPYRRKDFISKMEFVLSRVPDICIGTDIIVGFPGEGPGEFRNTLKVVMELPFSYLHIFPFSPRPDTPAAGLPGQVPKAEKKERARLLRELDKQKRRLYRERFIGSVLNCVWEQTLEEGLQVYRSDNYLKLYSHQGQPERPRRFSIRVSRHFRDGLYGEVISNE